MCASFPRARERRWRYSRVGRKEQLCRHHGGSETLGTVLLFFGIILYPSPQCCGSGMFIPDPNFFHPRSWIRIFSVLDSGSASKNFKYFNIKNCFQALGNMIRVVQSGSGSWFFFHPGSRGQKGTGSRIRNTASPDTAFYLNADPGRGLPLQEDLNFFISVFFFF